MSNKFGYKSHKCCKNQNRPSGYTIANNENIKNVDQEILIEIQEDFLCDGRRYQDQNY